MFGIENAKGCATHALVAVDGGTVELAAADASRAQRLPWFSSRMTVPELRASLTQRAAWDADVAIEGTVAVREGDTVRFVFGDDRRPSQQIPVIEELGATLSQFPDGTVLELCSAPPGDLG
jgi:hypothetical protein